MLYVMYVSNLVTETLFFHALCNLVTETLFFHALCNLVTETLFFHALCYVSYLVVHAMPAS